MELTQEQLNAVEQYKTERLVIVNGGPGVGKTTLIKRLIETKQRVLLIAPTGAAANRITQATGHAAYTFDKIANTLSMLEEFMNEDVLLDEGSMFSLEEIVRLANYLNPRSLCIVGDQDQLPCMSGFDVLRSLISLKSHLPVTTLTINHRQLAGNTGLLRTIESFRRDEMAVPVLDNTFDIVITPTDKAAIEAGAKEFLKHSNAQMLGYTNKAVLRLNQLTVGSTNRRVVCTENLYEPDNPLAIVANGCIGILNENGTQINYTNGYVDIMVRNRFATKHEPARAITVKRVQGNEFDAHGIIVITTWNGPVSRELPITALSRFKHKATVFTTRRCWMENLKSKFTTVVSTRVVDKIKTRLENNPKRTRVE